MIYYRSNHINGCNPSVRPINFFPLDLTDDQIKLVLRSLGMSVDADGCITKRIEMETDGGRIRCFVPIEWYDDPWKDILKEWKKKHDVQLDTTSDYPFSFEKVVFQSSNASGYCNTSPVHPYEELYEALKISVVEEKDKGSGDYRVETW